MMTGKRHHFWFCVLLVAGVSAGCITPPADPGRTRNRDDPDENKSLFAAVRKADRLVLYEGLPHQLFQAQQLENEKRQKQTVTLHDYPFYADPLDLSANDSKRLKELLSDSGTFRLWGGERFCGGFHPDYLVECHVGKTVYRFLLCFGCREAKVFGPGVSLRFDFQAEAYQQLKELHEKYHKNRPKSE